ncbi:SDR family NAD(P)-dependent oxidoreductase [Chitinophaga rhizophila]|uniref:SDR family NAD(P)-dependent oxidoreductase n=1 Tax=Chitinophaga rhizophila TaxID=2866212 RepID=A0ABS7GJB6_9BACT|nr:type I polyketide synthase [Chitinophaga rhizophila]MBW8687215.1 SDR family NAD(P)-dependent oxidoreductase [Chitinophaga rhizophila]
MSKYNGVEIAVIGMAGQFPGAENIDQFWKNLTAGAESVSFFSKEELLAAGESKAVIEDPSYVNANAYLEGKEGFDAAFFGYRPDEAALMDPQIRLFHQYCWTAMEDAGYDVTNYADKIGLFAGGSPDNNWENYTILTNQQQKRVDEYSASQLRNITFLCSRVSYQLNLQGPSIFVNTACSTSLVAIQRACMSLLLRECKMALAGGITLNSFSRRGYRYQDGMINSRDGHCRAFDEAATGTISGEGGGVVVLKRLADAIAEGDHIYAVIKGSGINNDGHDKMSFTAPGVKGQYNAVLKAINMAGVTPDSISFVETHGTGTHLGDPIEIEALRRVFGDSEQPYCALGAVKTNIGHLDAAAGIAGFIKTVLSLQHRQLVPTLHYQSPNPAINFENGPFYVNTKLKDWSHGSHPLRAGVSSFGIGGTNAHIVLEEAPTAVASSASRPWQLLLLSAKTKSALARNTADLGQYLQQEVSLADVAYTLQQGRAVMSHRSIVVCRDREDAVAQLAAGAGVVVTGDKAKPAVVFMFSGQGAQYVNMYRGLYTTEPTFRQTVDQCFQLVRGINGVDLSSIVFNDGGGQDQTVQTQYAQPLLFIMEYALSRLLMSWGITPDQVIGHSIGEYAAACLGGVLELEACLRLVMKRGALMQAAPAGSMLSISITEAALLPLLASHPDLSLAAVNSTELCVVSGPTEAIKAFESILTASGYKSTLLHTSHAFHSGMMDVVKADFTAVAGQYQYSSSKIPMVSTLSAATVTSLPGGYWVSQLREPVRFSAALSELLKDRDIVFVEVGPGNALCTFVRSHTQYNRERHRVVSLVSHAREHREDQQYLLQGIGALWQYGVIANWKAFSQSEKRNRLSLPTYSFDKQSYPVDVDAGELLRELLPTAGSQRQEIKDWFYTPTWKLLPAAQPSTQPAGMTLLFSNDNTLYAELGDHVILVEAGNSFRELSPFRYELNISDARSYETLFTVLKGHGLHPERVIHTWSLSDTSYDAGLYSVLHIARTGRGIKELVLVSSDVHRVLDKGSLSLAAGMGGVLLKVLSQEYPSLQTRHIDVSMSEADWLSGLVAELHTAVGGRVVSLRHGHRWEQHYEPLTTTETSINTGGIYLVTGGLGGFGYSLSAGLLAGKAAGLILTGRSALSADSNARIAALESQGCRVIYSTCDLTDRASVAALVTDAEAQLGGRITGVIHAAGIVSGHSHNGIDTLTGAEYEAQFKSKVYGMEVLGAVFADYDLDFFVATSSLSTVLGGIGFGAYAPANAYLDSYISSGVSEGRLRRWMSIDFDGLTYDEADSNGINKEELILVWQRLMSVRHLPRVVISVSDLQLRLQQWVTREKKNMEKESSVQPKVQYTRPSSNTNTTSIAPSLTQLWEEFFGIQNIQPDDDFFEIGGDSLKALTMIDRIQQHYQVSISFTEFLDNPSIKEISACVDNALKKSAADKQRLQMHNRMKQESFI